MTTMAKRVRSLLTTKLGACAACIRLSLVFSLAGWSTFAVLNSYIPGSIVTKLSLLSSIGFTGLFGAHLAAYSMRVVWAWRVAARRAAPPASQVAENRRQLLAASLRSIGVVFVPGFILSALQSRGTQADPKPDCNRGCDCHNCHTTLSKKCGWYYETCEQLCNLYCNPPA
jgi:hypothetical protein